MEHLLRVVNIQCQVAILGPCDLRIEQKHNVPRQKLHGTAARGTSMACIATVLVCQGNVGQQQGRIHGAICLLTCHALDVLANLRMNTVPVPCCSLAPTMRIPYHAGRCGWMLATTPMHAATFDVNPGLSSLSFCTWNVLEICKSAPGGRLLRSLWARTMPVAFKMIALSFFNRLSVFLEASSSQGTCMSSAVAVAVALA